MKLQLSLFIIVFSTWATAQEIISLPAKDDRVILFQSIVDEMTRLDGEGLPVRANRPETWEVTTAKLKEEVQNAKNLFDLGRVFKRLNATYPNLHANVYMHRELDRNKSEGKLNFDFKITPDLIERNKKNYTYYVSPLSEQSEFQKGDVVVAINNVAIEQLAEENFIFCKFPTRTQCALELNDNIRNEIIGWKRPQPLEITVLRRLEKKTIIAKTNVEKDPTKNAEEPQNCFEVGARYKDFRLDYKGFNICAFVSAGSPKKIVIRIKSFVYQPEDPITALKTEVDMFWFNYWRKIGGSVDEVIFDVIGNYGGQSPVPYYALFTDYLYQEMYVQFRKSPELEKKELLDSMLWGEKGKEIWLENIKKEGIYATTKDGEFLPPIPQFCANQEKDCRENRFRPKRHKFKGQVKLLVDQWCISSCVGFIDNMAKLFKGKVKIYGHEDSADSAYSRLTIAGSAFAGANKVSVQTLRKAKKPDSPEPWVRQVVAVTRSTDKSGAMLAGKPQELTKWIPRKWHHSELDWAREVFNKAVQ